MLTELVRSLSEKSVVGKSVDIFAVSMCRQREKKGRLVRREITPMWIEGGIIFARGKLKYWIG